MQLNWKQIVTNISEKVLVKRTTPHLLKEIAWRLVCFAAKCNKSNPLSFALRPLATHRYLRTVTGFVMAGLVFTSSMWVPSFAGPDTGGELELAVLPAGEVNLDTIEAVRIPLDTYHISQSYWLFHPGIDMAAPKGEPIYPAMAGQVTKIEYGKYAYGNNVTITHSNGYESLYAHMSEIEVKEGDEVTTETEIGKVGSTGRSTGPHLHLEIRDDSGRTTNPKILLEIK